MTFTTPSRDAIRDGMLRDLRSVRPDADTHSDSDWYVRATAHAGAAEGLYAHQKWIARQILPDECDDDILLRHAELRGVLRRDASVASGPVVMTGVAASATLPAGAQLRRADGVEYVTVEDAQPASGRLTVDVVAQAAGASGNAAEGVTLTLITPVAGVPASAASAGITGGDDRESLDDLRNRVQWRMRNPLAGGLPADYVSWALDVPGVHRAWVYPLRRGDGTVDVAIMTRAGRASAALQDRVQTYIDARRPIMRSDGCRVLTPSMVVVPLTGVWALNSLTNPKRAAKALAAGLQAYYAGLAPGDDVIRNQLIAIVASIEGVQDFDLTSPPGNVSTTVSEHAVQIAALGDITMRSA